MHMVWGCLRADVDTTTNSQSTDVQLPARLAVIANATQKVSNSSAASSADGVAPAAVYQSRPARDLYALLLAWIDVRPLDTTAAVDTEHLSNIKTYVMTRHYAVTTTHCNILPPPI
jgi:hypothetical protein